VQTEEMPMYITSVRQPNSLLQKKPGVVLTIPLIVSLSVTSWSSVPSNNGTVQQQTANPTPIEVASVCENLKNIKILPHKDEAVDDPVYNALLNAGEKATLCLISKITDTTEMADPRQAPKVNFVRVGDVAYFILIRLNKLDFVELLPLDVKEKYGRDGVYGYFELIDEGNNRKKLQDAAYKWYERKRSASRPRAEPTSKD